MRTAADPIRAGGGSACAVHTGAAPRCKITSDVQRLANPEQPATRLTRDVDPRVVGLHERFRTDSRLVVRSHTFSYPPRILRSIRNSASICVTRLAMRSRRFFSWGSRCLISANVNMR